MGGFHGVAGDHSAGSAFGCYRSLIRGHICVDYWAFISLRLLADPIFILLTESRQISSDWTVHLSVISII